MRAKAGIIESVVDNAATADTEPVITDPPQPAKRSQAVMRTPAATVIAIFLLAVGITPVAWTVPGLLVLYVIPAVLLYGVLRLRTTATPDGLFVRRLFTREHLPWPALHGFVANNKGRLAAVTTTGATVNLPAVRGRHLPVLSLLSGGRVPDPTGLTTTAPETGTAPATGSAEQDQDHDAAGGSQHES